MVESIPPPPDSHFLGTSGLLSEPTLNALSSGIGCAIILYFGHAERAKQIVFLELQQWFSRHDFDNAPKNVGRVAVVPFRTGLYRQWKPGDTFGEFGVVEIAVIDFGVAIKLPNHA